LGIGNQMEWAGNVPSEMLTHVYAEADLFLYPSRLEGFGLPLLEAFACGVPVIASNTTSLPEVAGDAALLIDPESPQAIAKAVKQMMEKPALRRRYIQRGLKRAKLFTWEKTARLTLKVYEEEKGKE
ncbi:MAG TPA: glycosyltransferase family 1 protein, partial [bacterium]|nr:glycosyltransferase family 1 protein [bacterium]